MSEYELLDQVSDHSELFDQYLKLEKRLQSLEAQGTGSESEPEIEVIIDLQKKIVRLGAAKKARLIQDAFYKLAIWRRWRGDDLSDRMSENSASDALVYSTYLDLAAFFNEPAARQAKAGGSG